MMSHTVLQAADTMLKVLTPVLAMAAGAIAVRGKTWDEYKHRPTGPGYLALIVGACTMAVGVSSSLLSSYIDSIDKEAALQAQQKSFQEVTGQLTAQISAQQKLASDSEQHYLDLKLSTGKTIQSQDSLLAEQKSLLEQQRQQTAALEEARVSQLKIETIVISGWTDTGWARDYVRRTLKIQVAHDDFPIWLGRSEDGSVRLSVDNKDISASPKELEEFMSLAAEVVFCGVVLDSDVRGGPLELVTPGGAVMPGGSALHVEKLGLDGKTGWIDVKPRDNLPATFFHNRRPRILFPKFCDHSEDLKLWVKGVDIEGSALLNRRVSLEFGSVWLTSASPMQLELAVDPLESIGRQPLSRDQKHP